MAGHGGVAVVTGAGSGIGRAIARGLAEDGLAVAVADINVDGAEETVAGIKAAGGHAIAVECDISDPEAVERLAGAVARELGTAGVVVNNAGWDIIQPFLENDRAFWLKVVNINYLGPLTVTRAFLPGMIERGQGGRVINIASDAGRVGSMGETVYAGAKGGVIAFSKSLAREMARQQITVNCVCPGPTDTPLFQQQPERMREALVRAIPFRRLGRPEDVAHAVRFFAAPGASYITGQVLSVSGGLTMAG
jgi:2-hydroxycyclohexanecarboxyl-CoA dehydrogenase